MCYSVVVVNDILFVVAVVFTVFLVVQPNRLLKLIGFVLVGLMAYMFKRNFMDKSSNRYDPNRLNAADLEELRIAKINRDHQRLTGKSFF